MVIWLREWWSRLLVQQKVWTILLALFVPLVATLCVHVTLINHLLSIQQQHRQIVSARHEILVLRRLAVDIEDAFRGYLLARQDWFLRPLEEAETKLNPTVARAMAVAEPTPDLAADVQNVSERLKELLESKKALIRQFQAGHEKEVLDYVRVGGSHCFTCAKAQSSQGVSASISDVSTVAPHQMRKPGGAER